MTSTMSDEVAALYRHAQKHPLVNDRPTTTLLDRTDVEALLPHRDPFLLVDRVTMLNADRGIAVARYDLARAQHVLAGHFPGNPVYPGALQVETIGQAGIIVDSTRNGVAAGFSLTHVQAARFIRPVRPSDVEIEVIAQVFDDGLFLAIVGQVLHHNEICAVAAVTGISGE